MMTNSAGLSGAKATTMLTMPLSLIVLVVVVVASHLHLERLARRRALEGALAEQREHERLDRRA